MPELIYNMFKKILIAEDLTSISSGVMSILEGMNIESYDHASYCDEAYLKIKRAILDKEPYQLLITDLSFVKDHRTTKLENGEALIQKLALEHPELPKIVFTIDDRIQKARLLIKKYHVKGYVCKGRNGLKDLKAAIVAVQRDELFFSDPIANYVNGSESVDIKDYDIQLLKQLAQGFSQEQISTYFKSNKISPSSLSTVEKRLNKLKVQFKANNATHLVAIVKDIGLI